MATDFRFPDVGEGITEGEIVKWKVKVGDVVKQDQVIVEVETDKAVVQLPSPVSGRVLKIYHREGGMVKVGETLVSIGEGKERVGGKAAPIHSKSTTVVGEIKESVYVLPPPKEYYEKAEGKAIDLKPVTRNQYTVPETQYTRQSVALVAKKYDMWGHIEHVPLKGVRKSIAKNVSDSVKKSAHVTHMDIADVTELWKLRERENGILGRKKIRLTFLPYVIKAVVSSLKKHPYMNSSISEENGEIVLKKYYNIGVAVDTDDGLIVPVVKGADKKGILEMAKEIDQLAEKTRQRKIDLMELKGGTFTITNVGSVGGIFATPIINQPEAAILALGRIYERPVADGGKVSVIKALPLSLTFDHRILDGAEAARFTNTLKGELSRPERLK